ncbi:SMP-30/gluconolactonase/LRE family protein [Nocardia sp. NPDC005978]|uniref:SMP-30/gluconolactonase/LRE family protein n=1 Tax=Nocardia sp. NPDC005978 TaxID=3156725 RepID=UPI0033A49693
MSSAITTLLTGYAFLEGPRWHEGRLWLSDMYTHQVLSVTADGGDPRVEARVPGRPSGLGWLPDGRLLIVSMRDRLLLRREPEGTLVTHADLSGHAIGHLNDMAVDRHGRAYIGSFGFDLGAAEPPRPASLLRADPDGTVTEVADDLWFPNGCVITGDDVLLVNETLGNRITAFDIGPGGVLGNRRVWARFGDLPGEADLGTVLAQVVVGGDGSALDADGGLWVADALHARLLRVLAGGTITDEIVLPTGVFACALGGADGRTLFACTAPDFDEHARSNAREAAVVALRVPISAAETPALS